MGESYFAFCQAVAENGVSCQAFAVDTWGGDVHTGTYGDEVFSEVDAHNTEFYNGFSHLLRMRFDQAIEKFDGESIDLLHIDGEHTYEAVKRDFLRWWPKVRPGGVVVMHDAAERHNDFGVWKLLEELRREFPVAEFVHSHGLGVVVKPPLPQNGNIATALVEADENGLCRMRRYYETCADHLQMQFLRQRQERGVEWEVTSQLFWHGPGADFTEANSIRLAHIVGAQRSEACLKLPASPAPYRGFRLALTLLPAFIQLHRITVTPTGGERLWAIDARNTAELQKGGLRFVAAMDRESLLILNPPAGAHVNLNLPDSLQDQLRTGGVFQLEMSGLDPYAFASRLAEAEGTQKSFAGQILRRLIG
jgi:hypothetical protein